MCVCVHVAVDNGSGTWRRGDGNPSASPAGIDAAAAGRNGARCAAAAAPGEYRIWDWRVPGWNANVIRLNQTNDFSVLKTHPVFLLYDVGRSVGLHRVERDWTGMGFPAGVLQHPSPLISNAGEVMLSTIFRWHKTMEKKHRSRD